VLLIDLIFLLPELIPYAMFSHEFFSLFFSFFVLLLMLYLCMLYIFIFFFLYLTVNKVDYCLYRPMPSYAKFTANVICD